jgi:hypothetical protein
MRIGQSRKHSVAESLINILVGIGVAFLTQVLVFPLFGIYISASSHIGITIIFTVVSFIRSYWLRRIFNYLHVKDIL